MQSTNSRLARSFRAGMLIIGSCLAFSSAHAQETSILVVKDFMFSPMSVTIKAGSTAVWKNMDDEPHTVVSESGLFRSPALDQNDTYKFKFDKPGVYKIFCSIHPNMKQTITVQ